MKKLLLLSCIIVAFTSCSSSYYQIYNTQSSNVNLINDELCYEDANCKISYNFWTEGGSAGFMIENKTAETLYVDLNECYFIKNGMAYDYFLNRTFTQGSSKSASVSNMVSLSGNANLSSPFNPTQSVITSAGSFLLNSLGVAKSSKNSVSSSQSVSIEEKEIISIPANSSKIITEYSINYNLYRSCDQKLFPSKKQVKALSFTPNNSPLTFSNIITYKVGENGNYESVENGFYVSDITNISSKNELWTCQIILDNKLSYI